MMIGTTRSLPVPTKVFKAIEKSDINALSLCTESEIRPILPCLVRMSLIAPLDHSKECSKGRRVILKILSGIEAVNALVALLSIDFTTLETDVKKEQGLRQKLGNSSQTDSVLIQNLANGLALEFECSDPTRRLRLLLSEILLVMAQMKEPHQDYYMKTSELFDNECYLEEVSDVLCIALAELPSLLSPMEVAEALLHLTNGPSVICKIVANQPDCFREVASGLILNGEKQDEDSPGGMVRLDAVRLICEMNPSQAQNARSLCVENCVMPALALFLSLNMVKMCEVESSASIDSSNLLPVADVDTDDIVGFVTGLLLSADHQQRNWFCSFIKSTMRRKVENNSCALNCLRTELIDRLRSLLLFNNSATLPDFKIIKAIALLRLYCALRSLGTIKFNEEKEVTLLLQLVTCTVPPTSTGVRFVSVALCFLIACPSVIGSHENEKKAADWIRWLVNEESYFAGATGGSSASFGAMLLLMAIHFHLNQLTAVTDLASTALGMKIVSRSNLARIKYIFTHDIFTEQVIAAHSVKVLVTKKLNANMPGLLPIHCIYHQLKSRIFSKHKIPIKNWIYKQICECSTPLHPVMPVLIEAFVNSVLVPVNVNRGTVEMFNEPITEDEILDVFSLSTFNSDNKANFKKFRNHNRKTWTNSRVMCKSIPQYYSGTATIEKENILVQRKVPVASVLTSQLLLLYYLLLHEDVRLNTQQGGITNRQVHKYSGHLFARLPIRYLLSNAQREQKMFAGVFSSLLKLLVSHYPQLCLLGDWLYEPPSADYQIPILSPRLKFTSHTLTEALGKADEDPSQALILMNRMLQLPPEQIWSMACPFVGAIKELLKPNVPRKILDYYHTVWLHLNSLFPRRLWAMTVECLRADRAPHSASWIAITEDDIVLDPLHVLRCDRRVFRCVPLLKIVIYMIDVYLLSSRSYLDQHLHCNPGLVEEEKEKLKNALVLTQESTAMQILLESTVDNKEEKDLGLKLALQEVRSIACSYLHHTFIKDTTLAKLMHFQGYPTDLIGPLVQGVPSMHIAVGLNWIPELLQMPDLEKQMFALELTANLALQNSMASTLNISRLAVNTVSTLVSVLSDHDRLWVMERSLKSILQIGRALPVLLDDVVHLLVSFGRVANAHLSLLPAASPTSISNIGKMYLLDELPIPPKKYSAKNMDTTNLSKEEAVCRKIKSCFMQLVCVTSKMSGLY